MKKIIMIALVCGALSSLYTQTSRFMLSNGMEVRITAQTASPIVRTELCIGGGFSSEERETAGFLDISTRLFWHNRDETAQRIKKIGISQTRAEFTSHAGIFSSSFPAFRSEEALDLLRELVSTTVFDDSELDRIQSEYRLEQKEFTGSAYGILHSLVMEHLYPENPWQQTPQMSYCYFQEVKKEKMRSILTSIRSRYYQPDNTCLFISAPFTEEQILSLVKKHFESWKGKSAYTNTELPVITQEKKKVVFVSDDLPSALEQYIAVLPVTSSGTKEESDLSAEALCFILNNDTGSLKEGLVQQDALGLEKGGYADISFEPHYGQSRIVFQSMLQKTSMPPVEKTQKLLSALQHSESYNDEILYNALLFKEVFSDTEETEEAGKRMKDWAQRKEVSDHSKPSSIFAKEIFSQKPFVFLLLNTSDYEAEQKNLEKDGWTVVHEKDLRKKIDQRRISQTAESYIERADVSLIEMQSLFEEHKKNIHESVTAEGLRIVVDPGSKNDQSIIVFNLAGGVLWENPKKPLIEKVIIQHLEGEIRSVLYKYRVLGTISHSFTITSSPGLTASTITIHCTSKDIESVLEGMAKALAFIEIKPSQADELIGSFVSTEKMAAYDISHQLYSTAVETVFSGTPYESALVLPDLDASLYSFTDIQRAVTRLFNAERLSFYISTDPAAAPHITSAVETYFSYLKKTEKVEKLIIEPVFPSLTRWKTLYRLFTTSISAGEAGERPVKLIPTTDFLDPAHLYFRRPLDERQSIFDASLIALERHMQELNDEKTVSIFENAEVYFDADIPSLCGIRFSKVQSYTALQGLLEEALHTFESWLIDERTIENTKAEWINLMMSKELPLRREISYESISSRYDQYMRLEKSSGKEFATIFEQLLYKQNSLWILSSDTKE